MSNCRLCLTDFLSLEDFQIKSIREKISTVFSFEVTEHPSLSNVICPDCVETVSQFYDYFCLVHQNQLKLYCQIENTEVKIKEEPLSSEYENVQISEPQLPREGETQNKTPELDRCEQMEQDSTDDGDSSQGIEDQHDGLDSDTVDEIKIEPIELHTNDFGTMFMQSEPNQSWQFENNVIFRRVEMICDICNEDQSTYEALETHLSQTHGMHCNFRCCGRNVDEEQLMLHLQMHNPIVTILMPGQKLRHLVVKTSEKTKKNPESEMQSEPTNGTWKYENNILFRQVDMTCEICREDQFTFKNLEQHLKKRHDKECLITCCGKRLYSKQLYDRHLIRHVPCVKSQHPSSLLNVLEKSRMFGNILTDFKKDLVGYEPIPNMKLAMQSVSTEQKKLYRLIEHLVEKYFQIDCELCGFKTSSCADRRNHFKLSHRNAPFFVQCCGSRFYRHHSIMRHLNNHWKPGATEPKGTPTKQSLCSQYNNNRMCKLMNEFHDELIENGFSPPSNMSSKLSAAQLKHVNEMQEYLISKHFCLDCGPCNMKISSFKERREHFRIKHGSGRFFILCCGLELKDRIKTLNHLLQHRTGLSNVRRKVPRDDYIIESFFKLNCELCGELTPSYIKLRAHFKDYHREEGFFVTCCNRRIRDRPDIIAHIKRHKNNEHLKCEHCEEQFSLERHRSEHMALLHLNYECETCKKAFLTDEMRQEHIKLEHPIYKCEPCEEEYETQEMLTEHDNIHHTDTCDICQIPVSDGYLPQHKLDVHQIGMEIRCSECPRVFGSQHGANVHFRAAHLGK